MRKIVFALAAVMVFSSAQSALALDNVDSFKLNADVVKPYDMTCKEFMAADKNMQLFVSAWYDGDSTTTAMDRVEYAREDVLDMQKHLIQGCEEEPKSTLEALQFNYGDDNANYKRARCNLLTKMSDVNEAVMYLGWSVGYLADERDDYTVNIKEFYDMSKKVFEVCQNDSRANLVQLVLSNMEGKPAFDLPDKNIDN